VPDLGRQSRGAFSTLRPSLHDTEYTESAVNRQRQHSRAIGFEFGFGTRKKQCVAVSGRL
jgi:hypothetical protein